MVVWCSVLLVLGALLYVNQVGLPGFVKRPLLARLHEAGVDLEFSRLRLRWYQGIVAEKVHFGEALKTFGPQLSAEEVQVRINPQALRSLQLKVDSLYLRNGQFTWPVVETNGTPRELSLTNVQSELRLLPNDQWSLDHFTARFLGARIQLTGLITNATAIRDWRLGEATHEPAPADYWQTRVRRVADILETIHFSTPPDFIMDMRGDAKDVRSFLVRIAFGAPDAQTPWGSVEQSHFTVKLVPTESNELSHAELNLEALNARTRWGDISNLRLLMQVRSIQEQSNVVNCSLLMSAKQVTTKWADTENAKFDLKWVHAFTNAIPLNGQGTVHCEQAKSKWATAGSVDLSGRLVTLPTGSTPAYDASWNWWTNIVPYEIDWNCRLADATAWDVHTKTLEGSGQWLAPVLTISNLDSKLYQGTLHAASKLDVGTRKMEAEVQSNFDPRELVALLKEDIRKRVGDFNWYSTPRLNGFVAATLPAWGDPNPKWKEEVYPTLRLKGELNLEKGGTYRGVSATSARLHLNCTNQVWSVPDLTLTRPEGMLEVENRDDERTGEFYLKVRSTIDLRCATSLFDDDLKQAFQLITFTQPPHIEGELWGQWHHPEKLRAKGKVALTNFTFRGESAAGLQTVVHYTNNVLRFYYPQAQREGNERMSADLVIVDLTQKKLFLTNGFSTANPMMIARCIGPMTAHAVEDYQFAKPPTARVNGVVPLVGEAGADLHFELDGGPFHWWRFNLPHVSGKVNWLGDRVTLKDMNVSFYDGQGTGSAIFDLRSHDDTGIQFTFIATNALLEKLMADLSPSTNQLEGRFHGSVVVVNGSSRDWHTINGYGNLELTNGFIWAIPIFGVFSPALDSISPGLGSSRGSSATASFNITNGVIRSDDFEMRSPAFRLKYRGTVDLAGNLNSRVEAELLRDMWVVGPLMTTIFWPISKMFEYRVSGNLEQPKIEPKYLVPRLVMMPFHPIKTIKDILPENPNARSNAPPMTPPTPPKP